MIKIIVNDGAPTRGELNLERLTETVRSRVATRPDPTWSMVDDEGHFHAYDQAFKLPTLTPRTRHVACTGEHPGYAHLGVDEPEDGEPCDGYDVVEHFCSICAQHVHPRRVREPETTIDRGERWEVVVPVDVPKDVQVTVRIIDGDTVRFGIAVRSGQRAEGSSRGDVQVTTWLVGLCPLGTRPARAPVPA